MEELQKLYTGYLDAVEQAQKKLVPASGLFGIEKKFSDDRCHDDFLEALGAYLAQKADTAASQEAREILERVYGASIRHQDAPSAVYWIFIAAHGLTRPPDPAPEPAGRAAASFLVSGNLPSLGTPPRPKPGPKGLKSHSMK